MGLAGMRRRWPAGPPYPEWLVHEASVATPGEVSAELDAEAERRRASGAARDVAGDGARDRQEREAMARFGVPAAFLGVPADMRANEPLSRGVGSWIAGPVGTGKTWSACSMARGWLRSGRSFRFVSSTDLLSELRSTFDGRSDELEVVSRYAGAALLVLDDLGKETPTDYALSKLFQVVDRRWANGLPTIVTSQLGPEDMAARLSSRGNRETADALMSRLSATCRTVRTGGPDRR